MFEKGVRYLLTTYGAVHTSGIFSHIAEVAPGHPVIMMTECKLIGETGPIERAQRECVYGDNQAWDVDGIIGVPWHDVSRVITQGQPDKNIDGKKST